MHFFVFAAMLFDHFISTFFMVCLDIHIHIYFVNRREILFFVGVFNQTWIFQINSRSAYGLHVPHVVLSVSIGVGHAVVLVWTLSQLLKVLVLSGSRHTQVYVVLTTALVRNL